MRRLFLLLLGVIGFLAVGAFCWWAFNLPGRVSIPVGGDVMDLQAGAALLAVIILGGVIAALWWLLTSVLVLPGKIGKSRQVARVRKANSALADGLLAAEAGDAKAALRLARKAARHAEDERLKLLLEARAAEANDDWSGAERAWGQLTQLPGGQLAGLRGAATAASARGDTLAAEARAREALQLKSGADWPFQSLFDLQVSRAEWEKALETLGIGERRGLIVGDALRRRRAVLHTARAISLPNEQRQAAQKGLAEAIRAAPGFPPAAWHGARHLMISGKAKAAQGVLELAWKARPHPALAQLAQRLTQGEARQSVRKRLKALINVNPEHRESRILAAELAMDEGDWVGAIKTLALLVEENPTARLCLLMERALAGYGDADEAKRWGRMAVSASREADWSDIDPKGGAFDYSNADWARLVYAFGDVGKLVHPRHETFGRELEAGRQLALSAPQMPADKIEAPKAPDGPLSPPLDYVNDEED